MCLLSEEVRATPCILGQGGVIDSTVGARPVRRYVQQKHEVSLILHSVQASQEFLFSYSSTTKRHTTQFKNQQRALAGVAQWIDHGSANQRVTGSISSWGTCLGCRPSPQWGPRERQPHTDISLPLFLPPFPSL